MFIIVQTCLQIVDWLKSWFMPKSQEIPDYADLNDYTTEGFYYCGRSMANVATIQNNPSERAFSLLVEKSNFFYSAGYTIGGIKQTVTRADNLHTWQRTIWQETEGGELKTTGWKKTFGSGLVQEKQRVWSSSNNLTYTHYVDEANRHCTLTISGSNISIPSGTTNYEVANFVPSEYRTKTSKFTRVGRSNSILAYMWNTGTVGVANLASGALSSQGLGGQMDWNY